MKALQDKYTNNNKRKPGWLQNFFILCSGAEKSIILEYPTEWNKFAGIGATIFLTACLAMLSGGYAMHFAFKNVWISVVFGIFWAIIIFNLDRYIVLSLRKEKIPTITDIKRESDPNRKEELKSERNRILRNQALMALPRFVIAFIIAVTVSKPIELRLFQNRIEKDLENTVKIETAKFDEDETKRIDELNKQLASINKQEQDDRSALFLNNPIYQHAKTNIPILEADIDRKEKQRDSNKKIIDENYDKDTQYIITTNPETGLVMEPRIVWRPNATARAKMIENKNVNNDIRNLRSELKQQKQKQDSIESTLSQQADSISDKYKLAKANISLQIESLNKTYDKRKNDWIDANKRSTDLPARLEALGHISKFSFDSKSEYFLGNSIWWASFVITLLFIALETAPVIVKLLTKRGPYDERLDAIEYQVYIEESKKIDTLNREINEYIKMANIAANERGALKLKAEKDKLDIELQNNRELLNKIAAYQKELAEIYVDAWYQEEKSKALQQVKRVHRQANQPKAGLEDTLWKQKGSVHNIEYYFRNGSLTDNELRFFKNNQMNIGKWRYNNTKDEITIDLLNNKVEYIIIDIKDSILKLKDKTTNDILEFEKI
jgi:hypothetical protein